MFDVGGRVAYVAVVVFVIGVGGVAVVGGGVAALGGGVVVAAAAVNDVTGGFNNYMNLFDISL